MDEKTAAAPIADRRQVITEKNEQAARELPELYQGLKAARSAIERIKALPAEHVNVHRVQLTAGGDDLVHEPYDKKAWFDLLVKDLEARAASIGDRIKALGFDPG
jgi:hypothetical protein